MKNQTFKSPTVHIFLTYCRAKWHWKMARISLIPFPPCTGHRQNNRTISHKHKICTRNETSLKYNAHTHTIEHRESVRIESNARGVAFSWLTLKEAFFSCFLLKICLMLH